LKTLQDADPEKKCFRSVGGVLVERTVKDVIPAVKQNMDGVSY
jgi:prefoldin subunit 2